MNWPHVLVAAGVLHLLIAAGNLLLPRILDYARHLPGMDPRIRQVYRVHAFYIIVEGDGLEPIAEGDPLPELRSPTFRKLTHGPQL